MKLNWLLVIFFVVCLYLLLVIRDDLLQLGDLKKERGHVSLRVAEISRDISDFDRNIKEIKTNKTIEKLARERLNFIKKGEIAYKVCQ
mgnify:CR=1 FL=1